MIRYAIHREMLRAAIKEKDKLWFRKATELTKQIASSRKPNFKPIWNQIKAVYAGLQSEKCCYCEKKLEHPIDQDVEHFRPKSAVRPWSVSRALSKQGVRIPRSRNHLSEPGYTKLAYVPFNLAIACKTCNSSFKRNYFPIEGERDSVGTSLKRMKAERPYLIYPIGVIDSNPEDLITFRGLSPLPGYSTKGHKRRRALVTIALLGLDDAIKRRDLFKERARCLRLLFLELEARAGATRDTVRVKHQEMIDNLTDAGTPHTNCLRSFKRLYELNRQEAREFAEECAKLLGEKRRQN